MARQQAKTVINNFTAGLNTDTHGLNPAPNSTVDEDNCDLDMRGFRKRRLGIQEDAAGGANATVTNSSIFTTMMVDVFSWDNVANNVDLEFIVVQWNSTLYFFDSSFDPLGTGIKAFTVDLNTHAAPGTTGIDISRNPIQVASGRGVLFVTGEVVNPFYITYGPDIDNITTTPITLRMRDFVQQDYNPQTLGFKRAEADFTLQYYYDLYNQGWGSLIAGNDSTNPGATVTQGVTALGFYLTSTGFYPPKSKPWWVGKRGPIDPGESGFEIFDPTGHYDMIEGGHTLAPPGHFILDVFNKDRAAAITAQQVANPLTSGFYLTVTNTDIPTEIENTRPTAIAFFAGRVFYGHKNNIYYSQFITDDLTVAGDCFQAADPTGEEINAIVATDGGHLPLHQGSKPVHFFSKGNSLLLFFKNGVWALGGATPGDGFSATSFSVKKITDVGALSARSIVDVEGTPVWWNEDGIFSLMSKGDAVETFEAANICKDKIQIFYNGIGNIQKEWATGAYDSIQKRIVWLYQSNSQVLGSDVNSVSNRFFYNRQLNFDVKYGAFIPWTISDGFIDDGATIDDYMFVMDVFNKKTLITAVISEVVTDNALAVVTDSGLDPVTIEYTVFQSASAPSTDLKYLMMDPQGVA